MDIKEMIASVAGKLDVDNKLLAKFKKNPESVVKSLLKKLGVSSDLITKDVIKAVVDGVKAKLTVNDITSAAGKLSGLFGLGGKK